VKLQCDLCREIVVADLAVGAATASVEVHCPACGGTFTVAATRSAEGRAADPAGPLRPAPGPGEPSMTCPKCGDVQAPADACRTCGLRADRMDGFAGPAADAPPEVAAAWAACEAAWADADRHDRLRDAVIAAGCYAWAARRYRDALRRDPGDPIATARLARVTRMTEATLRAAASPPHRAAAAAATGKPYRNTVAVLVGLVVLVGIGLVWAYVARSSSSPDPHRIPVRPAPHLHGAAPHLHGPAPARPAPPGHPTRR
jgi:hypothetical protein